MLVQRNYQTYVYFLSAEVDNKSIRKNQLSSTRSRIVFEINSSGSGCGRGSYCEIDDRDERGGTFNRKNQNLGSRY